MVSGEISQEEEQKRLTQVELPLIFSYISTRQAIAMEKFGLVFLAIIGKHNFSWFSFVLAETYTYNNPFFTYLPLD